MAYIKQKQTNTVIVTDSQNLSNHQAIINNPDIYEIINEDIPENASFMHYTGISKVDEYESIIYSEVDRLKFSAKKRALGKEEKSLSKDQLQGLEESYILKNEVAKAYIFDGSILNESVFNLMQNIECEIDFSGEILEQTVAFLNSYFSSNIPTENISRIKQYCYVVVEKFKIGSVIKQKLIGFIEVFRSTCLTWLENGSFEKIDNAIIMSKEIDNSKSIQQIESMLTNFKEL